VSLLVHEVFTLSEDMSSHP